MAKKKKGLIEQLKALLGLEKEPELMGAMCYETHMPSFVTLKCDQWHGKGVRRIPDDGG